MAYSSSNDAFGCVPIVHFGGDTHTPLRAYKWDKAANKGKPIMPTDQTYAGVSTADGEAGIPAIPGLLVNIDLRIGAGQSVAADDLLQIDTTNGWLITSVGTAFRVKEAQTNAGGVAITVVVQAEVWKPRG